MKIQLFGERVSGTKWFIQLLFRNFDVQFTERYGYKHFPLMHARPEPCDGIRFIVLVRHPVDWANALYRKPYHLMHVQHQGPAAFLYKPVCSVTDGDYFAVKTDDMRVGGTPFHSILDMRSIKLRYCLHHWPGVCVVRYEDLLNRFYETMTRIGVECQLEPRYAVFSNIETYIDHAEYQNDRRLFDKVKDKPPIVYWPSDLYYHPDYDRELEASLGYHIK